MLMWEERGIRPIIHLMKWNEITYIWKCNFSLTHIIIISIPVIETAIQATRIKLDCGKIAPFGLPRLTESLHQMNLIIPVAHILLIIYIDFWTPRLLVDMQMQCSNIGMGSFAWEPIIIL